MFLLDTNILSQNFRGNPNIGHKLQTVASDFLFTCSIVLAESYFGAKRCPNPKLKMKLLEYYNFLASNLQMLDFDLQAAEIFAQIKFDLQNKGEIVEEFDLMIASICLANNFTLVTNNTKHFVRIEGLKLEDWTKE